MFDRKVYFDHVRSAPFPDRLSQQQVDGQNIILTQWERQYPMMSDPRWLAYMLATTYHETAFTMWPIEEYGKGQGYEYGEVDPKTGEAYYGRGLVQLTWRDNYERATRELNLSGDDDLVWHPDRALDPAIATDVMFEGMDEGWFTSHRLGEYFNEDVHDPVNARLIINNDVQKNGAKIAGYFIDFLAAIEAAWPEEEVAPPTGMVVHVYNLRIGAPAGVTINVTIEKVQ